MTQLLPLYGAGSLILGFTRHDRFQHTFSVETRPCPPRLGILTWWDRKDRQGLARCESEELVVFEHLPEDGKPYRAEEGLRQWARLCAAAAPVPPRRSAAPITGWCSWYNLYGYITEENILEHLHSAAEVTRRADLPMQVFLIDDGFTTELGDWLEVKPQFPRGMKAILDDVRAAGFVPGLWIAPFMVGNRSRLYRDHPDWVLQDRQTGGPLVQNRLYAESRWKRRSEEHYILDPTHPQAFAYLREVFRAWRRDWGCEYFKTDFMYYGAEYGPERAVWRTPGKTRIESWHQAAAMIRQEIGEAVWLGCGCPLWASTGLVDAMRIGFDIGVEWQGEISAQSLLRDQATRNFANHILWQTDPDCVLLRRRFHYLSEAEVRSLALFAGMSGGVMMTSDDLGELSEERLRLWRLLLNPFERASCDFPLLGQADVTFEGAVASKFPSPQPRRPQPLDPLLLQVRMPAKEGRMAAVFAFNAGDIPLQRTLPLEMLGFSGQRYVFEWTSGRSWPEAVEELSLLLPPHDGALLFLDTKPILEAPPRLP